MKLTILFATKYEEAVYSQSAKTRPGADYSSDQEHFISKFRLKLKKVGKTIRPFRYDLNKILMIIQWKWQIDSRDENWQTECQNYGQRFVTLYRGGDYSNPQEKEMQKGKMVVSGGLE